MKFSARDTFLENASSGTLKVKKKQIKQNNLKV